MPSRLRTATRFLIAGAACILLGAATTVGSIIFLATREPLGTLRHSSNSCCAEWSRVRLTSFFMVSGVEGPAFKGYLINQPIIALHGQAAPREWDVPLEEFMPRQAQTSAQDYWGSTGRHHARMIEFHGWPRPAAFSVLDLTSTFGTRGLGVSATTGRLLPGRPYLRPYFVVPIAAVIPLQPIWPGLLVNTMVFSGAYGLLLAAALAPRTIRRSRRRRRCLCPVCGYSRAGLAGGVACPECGAGDALSAVP